MSKKIEDQKKCDHQWKDVGYGFGILRCEKCGLKE
jgi:hypothetical protein